MIENRDQVVQVAVGCEHSGLPDLAFLAFAVSHQREDGCLAAVELQATRHAGGNGEALAQRSRRRLDAGKLAAIGMPLKTAVQLAKSLQLLFGEIAGLGKRCVKHGSRMSLRKKETVAVLLLGIVRVMVEHATEIQRAQNLDRRERPSRMPASRFGHHFDDIHANIVGLAFQIFQVHVVFLPNQRQSIPLLRDTPTMVSDDELFYIAIENRVDVARFNITTKVLHHLVWV